MSTNTTANQIADTIVQSAMAGFSARWFQGAENFQYQIGAEQAAKNIKADHGVDFKVWNWNRLCGFYQSTISLFPDPNLNKPEIGWQLMVHSAAEIAEWKRNNSKSIPEGVTAPFDPQDNIIFVIHEVDAILAGLNRNHGLVTWIRSFIQTNGGNAYPNDESVDDACRRGTRLLVFLSVSGELSIYLPELAPVVLDVPGPDASVSAIASNMSDHWDQFAKSDGKDGLSPLTDQEMEMAKNALAGLPFQDREEAVAMAIVKAKHHGLVDAATRKYTDFSLFLSYIEDEKAKYCQGIPGVTYVPKLSLPTNKLPGYEAVDEYIQETVHIDPVWAKEHNLPPARGILLVGSAGTGKTEFSKSVARSAGRMLIGLSLGEIQGSLVGQSEANMRKVLSLIKEMKPVVFIDEIDKLGVSSIESGHQGDGGTYSRVIAMMLTAMTDPSNEAIWILAANRLVSTDGKVLLPAALIRPGRLDERYFVDMPDAVIRRQILQVQLTKYKVEVDSEKNLTELSGSPTDQWMGAELADVVIKATRMASNTKNNVLNTQWMLNYAATVTPQAKQPAFKAELDANRAACAKFKMLGKSAVPTVSESKASTSVSSRAPRQVQV